jgi:hypothetical protein
MGFFLAGGRYSANVFALASDAVVNRETAEATCGREPEKT